MRSFEWIRGSRSEVRFCGGVGDIGMHRTIGAQAQDRLCQSEAVNRTANPVTTRRF
jgi:hypothetical protein